MVGTDCQALSNLPSFAFDYHNPNSAYLAELEALRHELSHSSDPRVLQDGLAVLALAAHELATSVVVRSR